MSKTVILKFGGASLRDLPHFERVSEIIEIERRECDRLCVVVSAMEGVTDYLTDLADLVHSTSAGREKDMLLSAGERVSMALLAMLLQKKGMHGVSFTGSQAGIITTEEHSNAKIIDVRPFRIESTFLENKIPIIAGFQGVSGSKEVTTLGRGGSDTTAVALGVALGAERVVFYKDVDGVYTKDPNKYGDATIKEKLSYDEALEVAGVGKAAILHPRCIELAKKNGLMLRVRSFKSECEGEKGSIVFAVGVTRNREKVYYEENMTPSREIV